jgi:hypothetical protein
MVGDHRFSQGKHSVAAPWLWNVVYGINESCCSPPWHGLPRSYASTMRSTTTCEVNNNMWGHPVPNYNFSKHIGPDQENGYPKRWSEGHTGVEQVTIQGVCVQNKSVNEVLFFAFATLVAGLQLRRIYSTSHNHYLSPHPLKASIRVYSRPMFPWVVCTPGWMNDATGSGLTFFTDSWTNTQHHPQSAKEALLPLYPSTMWNNCVLALPYRMSGPNTILNHFKYFSCSWLNLPSTMEPLEKSRKWKPHPLDTSGILQQTLKVFQIVFEPRSRPYHFSII